MESRAHALAAGIFVVCFGLAGAAAVWWFLGQGVTTKDYVLVSTRAISGLNPQAQVRYRGVRSGKVDRIGFDPKEPRNILVHISVDAGIPVTKGTTAQLAYQGVTGLAYVLLDDSGEQPEPLTAPPGELPRIPLRQGTYETLVEQAGAAMRQVNEVATRAGRVLDDRNLANFSRAIDNLAAASEGMKDMPQVMAQLKQALSEENVQRLNRVLAHLETTAGEAAPLTADLRKLVASLQDLSRRVDSVAASVGGRLSGRTLPEFEALVDDLESNSRQLRRVLDQVEGAPQSLLFGRPAPAPGPGESGFAAPH